MIRLNPMPPGAPVPRVLLISLALLIPACGDPGTGPVGVKWDRVSCERCHMVLNDRHYSAQVRVHEPDGRSNVYFFDDLGCALIWLGDKPAETDPTTEIWVNDWRTGDWLDARAAAYVPNQLTPMEYGLGAQADASPGTLNFEQARAHIFDVERRYNVHGVHGIHGSHGIYQGHPEPFAESARAVE